MRYDFVHSLAGEFSVEMLCSVLGVSRTAYYRYQRGASYQSSAAKEENKKLVEKVFSEHKRRYGNRRIVAELQDQGHKIGRNQVRTLMRGSHLQAIQRQRPTV